MNLEGGAILWALQSEEFVSSWCVSGGERPVPKLAWAIGESRVAVQTPMAAGATSVSSWWKPHTKAVKEEWEGYGRERRQSSAAQPWSQAVQPGLAREGDQGGQNSGGPTSA